MGVGCVNMSWVAMGRIQVNKDSILPHASIFEHKKRKKYYCHILYTLFELLSQCTYILVEKIVKFCTCENTMLAHGTLEKAFCCYMLF
jgi:hypothetical protein